MARANRHHIPGQVWHITHRCHKQEFLLKFSRDRTRWLQWLFEAKKRYWLKILNYVVTSNHLLIETPGKDLSKVMHYLNCSYTTYINIKRKRCGHLFQGRYKAIVVDKDSCLLELSRYIHLNPVRANIVEHPEKYPYSSYVAYTIDADDLVTVSPILSLFSKKHCRCAGTIQTFC